jgi:hypothetical protein
LRKALACGVPYVAVLIGVYVLASGWIAIGLYHLGILLFAFASRGDDVTRPHMPAPAFLRIAAWGALAGGVALYWLWDAAARVALAPVLDDLGLSGVSWWVFCAYFVTVHPVLEELHWRRYLASDARGPAWQDAAFAGYHAVVLFAFLRPPFVAISFIAIAAVGWGWRRLANGGGFRFVVMNHAVADASVVLAASLLSA